MAREIERKPSAQRRRRGTGPRRGWRRRRGEGGGVCAYFYPKNLKGFSCRLERPRYMYFGPGRVDWLSVSIRAHLGSFCHPPTYPLVFLSDPHFHRLFCAAGHPGLFWHRDINSETERLCFYFRAAWKSCHDAVIDGCSFRTQASGPAELESIITHSVGRVLSDGKVLVLVILGV